MAVVGKTIVIATAGMLVASSCLQGCGKGASSTTATTTAVSTTVTTTTTGTPQPRTPAKGPADVAAELEKQFYGYEKGTDTSPLGVTMQWFGSKNGKNRWYDHIFCHEYLNPMLAKPTSCYLGESDCRLSAALHNHKILLTPTGTIQSFGGRTWAIVFDQTKVEQELMRCSYIWDGASQNKYNTGCGLAAPSASCKEGADSGYWNQCNGHTCTMADVKNVANQACNVAGGDGTHPMPTTKAGVTCFLPGPAVDYHGQQNFQANASNLKFLRTNIDFRVDNQAGKDSGVPRLGQNNELVLDVRLLMPAIWKDPATVVKAFVYISYPNDAAKTSIAKKAVTEAAKNFCEVNQLDPCVPVIAINAAANAANREKMFSVPSQDEEEEEEMYTETEQFLA